MLGTLSAAILAQQMPLLIHIYSTNFSPARRGQLVSIAMSCGLLVSIPFAYFGGRLLDRNIENYSSLYFAMAVAAVVAGILTLYTPSQRFVSRAGRDPIQSLALVWKDRVFGITLVMWMFMGFGNLSVFHLRVE